MTTPQKIIIGALLLLALGAGIWGWEKGLFSKETTPTPPVVTDDPYAGWQTYRNEEYGVRFEYPANMLQVTELTDSAEVLYINIFRNDQTGGRAANSGEMGIVLNAWANQKYGAAKNQGLCEDIEVFGTKGEVCDDDISDRGKSKRAFLSFVQNGTCTDTVGVLFFEPTYSNKSAYAMNNVYIKCDTTNSGLMKDFQKIFRSVRFEK